MYVDGGSFGALHPDPPLVPLLFPCRLLLLLVADPLVVVAPRLEVVVVPLWLLFLRLGLQVKAQQTESWSQIETRWKIHLDC